MSIKHVTFKGKVQEIAATDSLLAQIPRDRLKGLMMADPSPYFAEMTVGEEGVSHGNVLLDGVKKILAKVWNKAVVQELSGKVRDAKLFVFHDEKNDDSRPNVGEIVSSGSIVTKGEKLSARAVAYVKDQETRDKIKKGELDVCSIEAELEMAKSWGREWIVRSVKRVTGVALADSNIATPGFENPSIVAAIQMLGSEGDGR